MAVHNDQSKNLYSISIFPPGLLVAQEVVSSGLDAWQTMTAAHFTSLPPLLTRHPTGPSPHKPSVSKTVRLTTNTCFQNAGSCPLVLWAALPLEHVQRYARQHCLALCCRLNRASCADVCGSLRNTAILYMAMMTDPDRQVFYPDR